MRQIDRIIIHCSATNFSSDATIDDIRRWHIEENGWSDIGYHYVIERNAALMKGRPIERVGAHAKGYNATSIGICLMGGLDDNGHPDFNYPYQQMACLYCLVADLRRTYDINAVIGHRDVSGKECPCFDVSAYFNLEAQQ